MMPLLHDWETFYVIIGSSAAALTGLQFVVIALGSERIVVSTADSVAAFATPTIVHFCAVLTIAAMIAIPHQSPAILSMLLGAGGLAGVLYSLLVAARARRQSDYAPVLEDWLFHVAFPIASYSAVLVAGITAWSHVAGALYVVAVAALALLFTGIHNAWDAAVFMAVTRREKPPEPSEE
jgi:hypothetical protein